jgi:hypothetical protein
VEQTKVRSTFSLFPGVATRHEGSVENAGIVVRAEIGVKETGEKKILFLFLPLVIRRPFFRLSPA